MRRKSAILLFVTATAVLLCAILLITRRPILLTIGDFLVVTDELQPADVIHVLSGRWNQPTDWAVQLYNQGYGKLIFFTGGWCPVIDGVHAEVGRDRALAQGVPPDDIAIDTSSVSSTYSEAVRLKEFVAHSRVPVRSIIVVSDPYHMRRVQWTFRKVMDSQVSLWMAPVPFNLSTYHRQWWADKESRRMVIQEYLKIAYYYARYELSWGPVQEWLVALEQDR